jgi:hypothetical protein
VLGRRFLKCLNRARAGGDDCRNAASQRLDNHQAVGLDAGGQYQQISGIPFLIKDRADQHPRYQDPIMQSSGRDLGP